MFDYYEDILALGPKESIQNGLPAAQHDAHRLIYIAKSRRKCSVKRAIIIPYLHERKIYLDAIEPGSDYFQTIFEKEVNPVSGSGTFSRSDPGASASGRLGATRNLLVSLNLTRSEYKIFSLRGILRN